MTEPFTTPTAETLTIIELSDGRWTAYSRTAQGVEAWACSPVLGAGTRAVASYPDGLKSTGALCYKTKAALVAAVRKGHPDREVSVDGETITLEW